MPVILQNYEEKCLRIRQAFVESKRLHPQRFAERLKLSWSNWGFGLEPLDDSCARLERAGIGYIELHGNHYGDDLGDDQVWVAQTLEKHNLRVSGVCGMFSAENDLSSVYAASRQAAISYIRRELRYAAALNASYLLVCPAAVGRAQRYDGSELERSVDTLRRVADDFGRWGVRCAIEPIRSAETSLCHTVAEAKEYIKAVAHPAIGHINGDVYHMSSEESHVPTAVLEAGDMLTNLHMADTNRRALGEGSLDLDSVIMALYLTDFNNRPGCFVTPEPLGPGGDPYPARHAKTPPEILDRLVMDTAAYFRQREACVLSL